jgi:large subunit ribosomal protein L7/L12
MIVVSTIGTYTIAYVPVPTGPAVTLVDWSSASSLRQGLGAANELTVTCEGDRLTLAINGQEVAALRDGRSLYGAVEVFAAGPRSPVGLAVGGLTVRAAGVVAETGSAPGSTVGRTELVLRSVDASRKIHLIAAVRKITGLGIAGSRALVEGVPCVVKKGLSAAEAEAAKRALEAAGGRAEVR